MICLFKGCLPIPTERWSPRPGSNRVNLILTKDVLYLLSYVGSFPDELHQNAFVSNTVGEIATIKTKHTEILWSGKRDSNPRPSAWKADALAN